MDCFKVPGLLVVEHGIVAVGDLLPMGNGVGGELKVPR